MQPLYSTADADCTEKWRGDSILLKPLELEPHHYIPIDAIYTVHYIPFKTPFFSEVLIPLERIQSVYSKSHQQDSRRTEGCNKKEMNGNQLVCIMHWNRSFFFSEVDKEENQWYCCSTTPINMQIEQNKPSFFNALRNSLCLIWQLHDIKEFLKVYIKRKPE